jgi:hypothetical protein
MQRTRTGVGYVRPTDKYEHQMFYEQLGIETKGLVVHHIDKNIRNNNPDNLQLMTQADHVRLHRHIPYGTPKHRDRISVVCPRCNQTRTVRYGLTLELTYTGLCTSCSRLKGRVLIEVDRIKQRSIV